MTQCPFLTTCEEKVECFQGCAFYNYEETNGECPFKGIAEFSRRDLKNLYNTYYFDETDEIFSFESELEKVEYI